MVPRALSSPILVTGAHRSGTTWVGKMLALAPGTGYVHEPFNPRFSTGAFERYFTVVTAANEDRYAPELERVLQFRYRPGRLRGPRDLARAARDFARTERLRRRSPRPLVKDPIALLSAEWLAERFAMDVVVLIRHPAAFAASLKRLGWRHSFATFFDDGRLPEVLQPYEAEIREQAERPGEILEQAALLWRVLYGAVDGYRQRHPDWIFLRHEDASLDALRAGRDRPFERAREPGRADLAARRRARQRGEPRALARGPHARRGRSLARANPRRLAALLRRERLVAQARRTTSRAVPRPGVDTRRKPPPIDAARARMFFSP
jgi:hypothetical protein